MDGTNSILENRKPSISEVNSLSQVHTERNTQSLQSGLSDFPVAVFSVQ